MVLEKNYKKILLTKEDRKRITSKMVQKPTRKTRANPAGYKEVQLYFVDKTPIQGGLEQAEDELRRRIWDKKKKEQIAADFKKNHGGMFK